MNETIGVKGGKNDRRRVLKIKARRKKLLQELQEQLEIKELEKEARKKRRYVIAKTIPIVLIGASAKAISKPFLSSKEEKKEKKEQTIVVNGNPQKVSIYVLKKATEEKEKEPASIEDLQVEIKPTKKFLSPKGKEKEEIKKQLEQTIQIKEEDKEKTPKEETILPAGVKEEEKKESVLKPKIEIHKGLPAVGIAAKDISIDLGLTEKGKETYQKLRAHKIIDVYYEKLKEIRYDLRNLVYEYNVLVSDEDEAISSKELGVVLDKLSDIIRRLEVLKSKLKVDNLDKYDDNYIYTLIEDYLKEFQNGKVVSEIKDSPLYIMVSQKLAELDQKKESFQKDVRAKKGALEKKEKDFDKMKDKYNKLHRIDEELLRFQYDQDALLKELQEKVRNATSVSERVEVQVEGLNRQSRRLLALLTLSMFIPGANSAKKVAASTAAYLYFVRNVLNPRTRTIRHRIITVQDYSDSIKDSITTIQSTMGLLGKTGKEIDKLISSIRNDFSDYIGVLSECDELLYNLNRIKDNIKEKEYEMAKIKKGQEALLEQNNAKVLTRGEYPM